MLLWSISYSLFTIFFKGKPKEKSINGYTCNKVTKNQGREHYPPTPTGRGVYQCCHCILRRHWYAHSIKRVRAWVLHTLSCDVMCYEDRHTWMSQQVLTCIANVVKFCISCSCLQFIKWAGLGCREWNWWEVGQAVTTGSAERGWACHGTRATNPLAHSKKNLEQGQLVGIGRWCLVLARLDCSVGRLDTLNQSG